MEAASADDAEGRLERQIFREMYARANYPDGGAHVEAAMFPILFPHGAGVFVQERPRQPRFVEYRDHLLRQADPRFRNHPEWRQWSDTMVEAIAAIRAGDEVEITEYSERANSGAGIQQMQERIRTTSLEQRTMNPLRIRHALEVMVRTNPAFRGLSASDMFQKRLEEARQVDGNVIEECAICHRYECPEDSELRLMKWGRCRHVFYCGKEHQKQDWDARHKRNCRKLAATLQNTST